MTKENQELNKQLRQEYEKIAEKALTTPANTDQLMELKEYIEKVEEKDIFVLEQRMVDSMGRLKILIEHTTFTQSEIRLNAETFDWLTRMPSIFAEHKEIISQTRREAEEALKVSNVIVFNVCKILISAYIQLRRERFNEELESYARQVEEFEMFGELEEVARYQKKAQSLRKKLEAAQEKIEAFNNEEDLFEWDRTQYPQRNKLVNKFEPYVKLYDTVVDFQEKYQ